MPSSPARAAIQCVAWQPSAIAAGKGFLWIGVQQELACYIAAQHAGAGAQTELGSKAGRQGRFAAAAEPSD